MITLRMRILDDTTVHRLHPNSRYLLSRDTARDRLLDRLFFAAAFVVFITLLTRYVQVSSNTTQLARITQLNIPGAQISTVIALLFFIIRAARLFSLLVYFLPISYLAPAATDISMDDSSQSRSRSLSSILFLVWQT